MTQSKYLLLLPLLLLLIACAPVAQERAAGPEVSLINAPAEQRVSRVAGALQAAVLGVPGCCEFTFSHTQAVRFQETHRDMFGSRAAPQAASLARNLGASLAVMAGAPTFERTVQPREGARRVSGAVQLQVVVLDSASGETLATVGSRTFQGSRNVPEGEDLPDLEEDPTMIALVEEAVADLAPHLAAVLSDLARERAQRK